MNGKAIPKRNRHIDNRYSAPKEISVISVMVVSVIPYVFPILGNKLTHEGAIHHRIHFTSFLTERLDSYRSKEVTVAIFIHCLPKLPSL